MKKFIRTGLVLAGFIAIGCSAIQASACAPTDFLAIPVPQNSTAPALDALQIAYADIELSQDGSSLSVAGQGWLDIGRVRPIPPAKMMQDPTILEQFIFRYPLEFDLERRHAPYFDPGRLRNGAFFEALYFQSEQVARDSLEQVTAPLLTQGVFQVTRKRNVACQLEAALGALAASGEDYTAIFNGAGGGFNWRHIAGTSRLSAHSFGIAVDVNAELGKYWRWTGAQEGAVGQYDNAIPESLVTTMERFGFIWGGKWHHFDGMHFEYRPELILHSRMTPG